MAFEVVKVVNSLPGTLEPNSIYAVRRGVGCDLYVTTVAGAAIRMNADAMIQDRHTVSSATVQTTISTAWQDKLNATFSVDGGEYLLTVSYGWNYDAGSDDFGSRLFVDGALIHKGDELHRQEPKDSVGAFTEDGAATQTNQKHGFARVFPLTLTAGNHDFQLQWKSFLNGTEASIWDAHLILERTSL